VISGWKEIFSYIVVLRRKKGQAIRASLMLLLFVYDFFYVVFIAFKN